MNARDYIEAQRKAKLAEAKAVTDKAKSEARSLAVEEKMAIEALLKAANDLQAEVEEMTAQETLDANLNRMLGTGSRPAESVKAQSRTIGEAFVNSDAFNTLLTSGGFKSRGWRTGPIEMPFYGKEAVPISTLTTGSSAGVQVDQRPGIIPVDRQRLTVADLIPSGTTSQNSVRYMQQVGFDETDGGSVRAAAPVIETGLKPEARAALEEVDEPVRTIAVVLSVSDIMLEDVEALRAFLDSQLRDDVLEAEEDQLLNGDGTTPNLSGLLDRAIQTAAQSALSSNPLDAVYKAITAIRTVHSEPTGIVVNSTDWEIFRLAKDGNEQYYGGGPFTGAYGNGGIAIDTLWGKPVVITSAIDAGTLLVGAFNKAQIFRRSGLVVDASNSHNDYFQRNMTMLRAEERLALAVYKPAAFFEITGVSESA